MERAKKATRRAALAAPVPPTFAHGKIFAMLGRGSSLVVKLPRERVDELARAGKGQHFDPGHGRLMKE